LFREALLSVLHTSQPELVPLLHRRAATFYETEGEWAEAIIHWLAAADFPAATQLMEQTVEQFWVRGEAATIANWVLELPETLVREHARLMLTTALYLLNTVTLMIPKQRARVYQQVRQLMARVETALREEIDEPDQERLVRAAEDTLLHRRLRLLHRHLVLYEAVASGDFERLNSMQQEIEETLNQDEEAIWQMEQLLGSVLLYYTARVEGGRLVPRLLSAKEQVDRKASRYASIKIRQWLAQAAVEAGQLHLAYEACQAALDQIEQVEGYSLLKGYPQIVLAMILYQWNYLDEARNLLQAVVRDSITWQHLDLPAWGYNDLLQVELARGDGVAAQQALHEMEQLVQRERYLAYSDHLPIRRAQWWLAQGQLETASAWAASVVFPQGAWEDTVYYAFPVVIRVHFARQRWREALDLLERWHTHLDRPANIRITITYLAQLLVALHQAGQRNQTRVVAARLFALTEPEGYLRVYLDEGKPMRQALEALLPPRSHQHKLASS
ncbi:MAG: LuxR family transcriptional regulator, partial [Ktedonobacteraceae bacterium]|nr:LuxR family transcriptional regulator [Ktedonobacteraceae bacterium]